VAEKQQHMDRKAGGPEIRYDGFRSRVFWPFVLFTLIVSAIVFAYRLSNFGDMEPRVDQAYFAWWVQGMAAADHLLPHPETGESLFAALARDETGFLTQLFRPIYSSTTELFKLVPLLAGYTAALLFGASLAVQVATGIVAGTGVLFVLALYPFWWPSTTASNGTSPRDAAVGVTAVVLGGATVYLHLFSALGAHNFGILFLVIAIAVAGRFLPEILDKHGFRTCVRPLLALTLASGLAFYSYKTNVFLLPVAVGLFILSFPGVGWRRRLGVLSAYAGTCLILIAPIFLFFALDAAKADFAKDSFSLASVWHNALPEGPIGILKLVGARAVDWFRTGGRLFSWPGLVAGLGGLGWMAAVRGRGLPLCLAIAHFLVWCWIPLFAATGLRTYPYILPFLILGNAYLVVNAFGTFFAAIRQSRTVKVFRLRLCAVAVALITVHVGLQAPAYLDHKNLAAAYPDAWRIYMKGQGELRPMVAEIEALLPPNAVLMTWGYGLQYVFRNLKQSETRISMPAALNALALRHRAGLLKDYIHRRHLVLPPGAPFFLLVDPIVDHTEKADLGEALGEVLGSGGFGLAESVQLEERRNWVLTSSWPKGAVLYAVRFFPAKG